MVTGGPLGGAGTPAASGLGKPRSVALWAARPPAAGVGPLRGAGLCPDSSKMCVVSSSSSQDTGTPGPAAAAGGALVDVVLGAGATTGGKFERPGSGGGARDGPGGGVMRPDRADGGGGGRAAATPSNVRLFAATERALEAPVGGGGGVLCVREGGRVDVVFFSSPSKTSRSDPPLSSTIAPSLLHARALTIHWSARVLHV